MGRWKQSPKNWGGSTCKRDHSGEATYQMAKLFDTNREYARMLKHIMEHTPLFLLVDAKRLRIADAYRLTKWSPENRDHILCQWWPGYAEWARAVEAAIAKSAEENPQ